MKRLANKHAIKRITMVHWKSQEVAKGGFFQGEAANLMLLATIANVLVGWFREWQFPELMLHENLPDGYDAQEHFVRLLTNAVCERFRQSRVFGDVPEEGVCIEK